MNKTAIIIGAGPAGLTAAYELVTKTDIKPIIVEATNDIGGISKTVNYKGNRIDIGGHRFFSKSDKVMAWWQNILELENEETANPQNKDTVLLKRSRLSRIFYMKRFFNYPVTLTMQTLKNLGFIKTFKIGITYLKVKIFPIKVEKNLEDFLINRFGSELYQTFFENYTTKVWGTHPKDLSPDWGAQRIKGISITEVLKHAIKSTLKKDSSISQKNVETSLIDKFLYPKFGPGQMWEETARIVREKGGEIRKNQKVEKVKLASKNVTSIICKDTNSGEVTELTGDYFFSTMPVKDLINAMEPSPSEDIVKVANGLNYRDFVTVGLLVNKFTPGIGEVKDNWIYIHDPGVLVGRIQIFNNWSPYLIQDKAKIWIGLEYFCNEGDSFWSKTDKELLDLAVKETNTLGLIGPEDFVDGTVIRMKKTYPTYNGTYDELDKIKEFTNGIPNIYLIGRNGMHRYNNQDHSMLTAIEAVNNIIEGKSDKSNIWEVNTEEEYHETKKQ